MQQKWILSFFLLIISFFSESAKAQPGLVITEVVSSGGTPDWIELTNMSDTVIYMTGYKMDDGSCGLNNSVALLGIDSILPWESVIYGESSNASLFIPTYLSFWDFPMVQVGTYAGSGVGLSSGGDGVCVFNSEGMLVSTVSFPAATAGYSFFWEWNWDGALNATTHLNGLGVVSAEGTLMQQITYMNSNANSNWGSPGTAIFPLAPNFGCMDESACNYDSLANVESGFCIYPQFFFLDEDGDGFGNQTDSIGSCMALIGFVSNDNDCNDLDPNVSPNAGESCINDFDDNCDGLVNVDCPPLHYSIKAANNFIVVSENADVHELKVEIEHGVMDSVLLVLGLSSYTNATNLEDFVYTDSIWVTPGFQGELSVPIVLIDDDLEELSERIIIKLMNLSQGQIDSVHHYQILFIQDNDSQSLVSSNAIQLELLTSYSNGAAGFNSAEIVAYDDSTQRLLVVNSVAAQLDIVDFSNPNVPVLFSTLYLDTLGGINSVAVDQGRIALAMENVNPQDSGFILMVSGNGDIINQLKVGAMPDMICFSPDHNKLLTANEGEPNADYSIDPNGSISIVDVSGEWNAITQEDVITLDFSAWNDSLSQLLAYGLRIFGTGSTVAMDIEPEYIAVSNTSSMAYVTLQENNGIAIVDLENLQILDIRALGGVSYMSEGNAMDASDMSGEVLITGNLPIRSTFMPDAIAYANIASQGYLFTANEGDSREFGDIVDANRIASGVFELDSAHFPDAHILKNKNFLGRLNALKYSGDTDGDGDYDELHTLGGRSFSIWDAQSGQLVFDSKYILEKITSESSVSGAFFNASNSFADPVKKNRSDDKGPEPEGVVVKEIENRFYAFVALERVGGVVVFDVTIPTDPVFVTYANNRLDSVIGPDLGAEGILYIPAENSPNGKNLVLLANEVSSTITVFQINSCSDLTHFSLVAESNQACEQDSLLLFATYEENINVTWNMVDAELSFQHDSIWVHESGLYFAGIQNLTWECSVISDSIFLEFSENFSQYRDEDSDGYGWADSVVVTCDTLFGYVLNGYDCNDTSAQTLPGALEVCNYWDDNCNGEIDEALGILVYYDADGDGFGSPDSSNVFCNVPLDYVSNANDCDDGQILYLDMDEDGFGTDSLVACGAYEIGDCDDDQFGINPAADEISDNDIDENCDGLISTDVFSLSHGATLVFPNPTCSVLYCNDQDRFRLILDSQGRLISNLSQPLGHTDVSSLADGHYYVVMESGVRIPFVKACK